MSQVMLHPRYKRFNAKLIKLLCLLNFNHSLTNTGFDHKGSDFRYVYQCNCGKRKEYSEWTDDNHVQGYGTKK